MQDEQEEIAAHLNGWQIVITGKALRAASQPEGQPQLVREA